MVTGVYTPIDLFKGKPSHTPGFGLGGFVSVYTLVSECVRGQRWRVTVIARPTSEGGGLMAFSLPAGFSGTHFASFEDGNIGTIDPYVFNGTYSSISSSLVVGAGTTASATAMGNAYGEWSWVPAAGADWYGAVMTGYSNVISAEPELCDSCEK